MSEAYVERLADELWAEPSLSARLGKEDTGASQDEAWSAIDRLRARLAGEILGQQALIQRLLIALLADGHLLLEGAPGLAKTRAVKVMGEGLDAEFDSVQLTPDMTSAELTGGEPVHPGEGGARSLQGPIFHNMLLAEDVDRAPARVQSALAEMLIERRITLGRNTYPAPPLFLVVATQTPPENTNDGSLSSAQLDHFLMHVRVAYPDRATELAIVRRDRETARGAAETKARTELVGQDQVFAARRQVLEIYMASEVEHYLANLVLATRSTPAHGAGLGGWLRSGAGPRATLALDRCARAQAWLNGRDYVSPDDVQAVAPDVLRHRLVLTDSAKAEGVTLDACITRLLDTVAVG